MTKKKQQDEITQGDKVFRHIEVILTEQELLAYGKDQAHLTMEIQSLEKDRKAISDQINPKKKRVKELAKAVDEGKEFREVECQWEYNWTTGLKHIRRLDTDEIVGSSIEIEEHEKQGGLEV